MAHATAAPKILVVEHEPNAATAVAASLIGFGCAVVGIAVSAHEAIDLATRAEPELVLLDVAFAGDVAAIQAAGGFGRGRPIPVLLTVADTDAAGLRRLVASRACDYLLKPLAVRELRVAITRALDPEGARRAVGDLEERFFDVSIDMLCCLGFDGHFRRLNLAWERTLGFTREELMSRPFLEFVHPDDRERTLRQNREVRGGGQAHAFENRYRCRDGSYRWLLWNATADAPQHVIYSVARDVTERKRADEEREALVGGLQSALAEVRTLRELLSICAYCRRIRDDEDAWHTVEAYLARHTATRFSHGICPSCFEREVGPQLDAVTSA